MGKPRYKWDDTLDKEVKELLTYDSEGYVYWKAHPSRPSFVGKKALNANSSCGYFCGKFRGRRLLAHRVVFFLHYGWWPPEVDHIDGETKNNRPENLRPSCSSKNKRNKRKARNNTSGHTGIVVLDNPTRYKAKIMFNYRYYHLGVFDKLEDALEARENAQEKLGFSKRHGKD